MHAIEGKFNRKFAQIKLIKYKNRLNLRVYFKKKTISNFDLNLTVDKTLTLKSIFSELEKLASSFSLKNLQINNNDILFRIYFFK